MGLKSLHSPIQQDYKTHRRHYTFNLHGTRIREGRIFSPSIMRNIVLFVFLLITFPLFGQEQSRSVTAKYITGEIQLDGILDEPVWETADSADNFWQFFPTDTVRAEQQTVVRLLYNDHTLYAGIRAEVPGDNYVVSTLRRDFSGTDNDNVGLMFDTFNDGTTAYMFGVTPYGVQREVYISGGGTGGDGFNSTWDQKWEAESKRYEDHYVIEMAIPFSSLKFPTGSTSWGFQAYRWDLQSNERSEWSRVPQNQLIVNLAFMGDLNFERPLGESHTPLTLIPYINTLADREFIIEKNETDFRFGGDAKIAIGNTMNLDITVNPDFSNVEVDNIFTNLTRFEVSLPERRQFFIDNSDLFGNFGTQGAQAFFSRRIGIARDTLGNSIENRIIAGARLSGKLTQNLRLGLLNVQTDEDLPNEIPSNNNMMLALQQRVLARSSIGFFFLNRQTFQDYDFLESSDKYNRVIGTDFNLATADNVWNGTFYLHKSYQPDDSDGNYSSQAMVNYNTRNYNVTVDFFYVGEEFRSDLGFIRRTDVFRTNQSFERVFWPEQGIINNHGLELSLSNYWRPTLDYKKTDYEYSITWNAEFRDQSTFQMDYSNNYVFLNRGFDPTRTEGAVPLPGNRGYYFNQLSAQYRSDRSGRLAFNVQSTYGEFYTGNRLSFGGSLDYRVPPWATIGLSLNYDQIRLPAPYSNADLWLLSPDINITFSKTLFWSTLIQYSNQRDNLGINSRLQWRFAPLSDLYLVYNDNYFVEQFSPRFRSINLKLTYWLNI